MSRHLRGQLAPVSLLLRTIVKKSPGIHFRGLGRAANVASAGQLRHHIDRLGRRGELIELRDGRFKRFFVPGDHDARVRQGLARFARRVPHFIGRLLLEGAMNRTELRRSLGCADSTLGYHLSRMVGSGDVMRTRGIKSTMYSLADPEFVRQILLRHAAAPIPLAAIATIAPAGGQATTPKPMAPVGPGDAGPIGPSGPSPSLALPTTSPTGPPTDAPAPPSSPPSP